MRILLIYQVIGILTSHSSASNVRSIPTIPQEGIMEFEGTEADEVEETSSGQEQKKGSVVVLMVLYITIVLGSILALGLLFTAIVEPVEYKPSTSDKVADILSGAYYDGVPNTYVVPLSESSNATYGGEAMTYLGGGDCKIAITYEAGGDGRTEFATAVTHTPKCRVAYSVDTVGYFEDWVYPDTQITYTSDDPGLPIRAIAFAACMPQHDGDPIPNCTIVKMGGQSG